MGFWGWGTEAEKAEIVNTIQGEEQMEQEVLNEKIVSFLNEIKSFGWFENCGTPNEKYHLIFSLFDAVDCWGSQYIETWEPPIYALESTAQKEIGDDKISEIFNSVSAAIGSIVWDDLWKFIDEKNLGEETGVCLEVLEMVKRDMAWACVEKVLDMPGFFTMLTEIYKEGHFPCSWDGIYPSGLAVVL